MNVHTVFARSTLESLQIHGFAMQSYTKTNANNFFGQSSGEGSLDYRELGLNFSLRPMPKLQIASQALSRRAGDTDKGKLKLDFAVVDYRLIDQGARNIGVRMGRVKGTIGFYNDTRDVSFTRESIILPQSIYFERTRDFSISSDGIFIYGSRQFKNGDLDAQYAVVKPRVEGENMQFALLGKATPGHFTAKPSFGGRLRYVSSDAKLTVALSNAVIFMEYDADESETGFTKTPTVQFNINILSLRYDMSRWGFTAEYARRNLLYENFPDENSTTPYVPSIVAETAGESYYLQVIFRPVYRWNLILRYDVLYADSSDKDGIEYANTIPGSNNFARFAKDAMFGVQWNASKNWMLRAEIHNIDGTAWLPRQDNPNPASEKRNWRMLNSSISYRF